MIEEFDLKWKSETETIQEYRIRMNKRRITRFLSKQIRGLVLDYTEEIIDVEEIKSKMGYLIELFEQNKMYIDEELLKS